MWRTNQQGRTKAATSDSRGTHVSRGCAPRSASSAHARSVVPIRNVPSARRWTTSSRQDGPAACSAATARTSAGAWRVPPHELTVHLHGHRKGVSSPEDPPLGEAYGAVLAIRPEPSRPLPRHRDDGSSRITDYAAPAPALWVPTVLRGRTRAASRPSRVRLTHSRRTSLRAGPRGRCGRRMPSGCHHCARLSGQRTANRHSCQCSSVRTLAGRTPLRPHRTVRMAPAAA